MKGEIHIGNFYIQKNRYDMKLNVKMEGTFSGKDDEEFVRAFTEEIKTLPVSEYDIEVDCSELNVSIPLPEHLHLLESNIHRFQKTGFKKILFIVQKSFSKSNCAFIENAKKTPIPQFQLIEI
ncbi:hypothetical protein CR203_15715 [Salipaludibacillus neizhouensis]|uniref:STAS domain-containing protein n=2 Tax=Salipaludibacillus neizhouensis TaxID=885475 RepID=A0A3A9KNN5_9BACI|nr:hypothetical protein [Salipaludibacillus neizhouensis]RKL66336.1 hypothetical protein CR203_15715 [Salipaludibacillus neizhouensis]